MSNALSANEVRTDRGENGEEKPTPEATYSLTIVLVFHLLVYVLVRNLNDRFPNPLTTKDMETSPSRFIEENAVRHLRALTSLGDRMTGSEANEVHAVASLLAEIESIQKSARPVHQIDVQLQEVSGSFSLGFLKHFSHSYENVKNLLVQFKPKNVENVKYLLINCHFDTVCQSPGASDDGASCSIMLETLRALSQAEKPFAHGLIMNFNGAEENILQASHGFITKHPWARDIKAFINLEAAGGGGWELLFQSGPQHPWLLKAYAESAPYPFAHGIAQDIFQNGLVPSDTDYRIYRDFGKLPGLDIAYISNGYIYHTQWDDMKQIPPGCLQRGGENVLGLLTNLLNSPYLIKPGGYKFGSVVFFDFLGLFMVTYSEQMSRILNVGFGILALSAIAWKVAGKKSRLSHRFGDPTSPIGVEYFILLTKQFGIFLLAALLSGCVPALVASLLSGFIFEPTSTLGSLFFRPMSWYANPTNVFGLYFLPSMATFLFVIARFSSEAQTSWIRNKFHLEDACADGIQLLFSVVMLVATFYRIISAYLLLLFIAIPFFCRYLVGLSPKSFYENPYRCLLLKLILYSPAVLYLTKLVCIMFQFFVPIMGRVGSFLPSELVIGLFSTVMVVGFASVWFGLIFVVGRRAVDRVAAFMMLAHIVFLAAVLFTPLGFAYHGQEPHPRAQRSFLHHINFVTYDRSGNQLNRTSRLWFIPFDFYGHRALQPFVPELRGPAYELPDVSLPIKLSDEEEFPAATSRPFMRMPFYFPIHFLMRKSLLLPEIEPFEPPSKIHVSLIQRLEVKPGVTKISLSVKTHDHMSVMIMPRPGHALSHWSVGDGRPKVSDFVSGKTPSQDRYGYFIFYGSGRRPAEEWKLEFEVTRLFPLETLGIKNSDVVVDLNINPHFVIGDRRKSKATEAFLEKLPSWSYCVAWTAEQHLMMF